MATSKDRLVVAIDFGTTFTGVAACYSNTPDDIEVIKTWPGGNGITSEKVPSEFMYTTEMVHSGRDFIHSIITPKSPSHTSAIKDVRWGFQLKPGEDRIKCIKLFLDSANALPDFVRSTEVAEKLHIHDRDVISAVADYLHKIREYAIHTLQQRFGQAFMAATAIHFVLTVPAIWSDVAKDATFQAARRAGITGSKIDMISEPEAAATYTLKAIQPNNLKIGDNIVVCDAGGGTVDLISYRILQLEPLAIQESNVGTGGLCGSAFLNLGFEKLVRDRMGAAKFDDFKTQKPKSWQTALKNFEDYVKRSFCAGDVTEENVFNIPFPGLPDDERIDLIDGFLIITADDVGSVFDPVIKKVTHLVEEQVSAIRLKGGKVSAIVLVGGFGQSSYLYSRLNGHFNNDLPPPYPGGSAGSRRRNDASVARTEAIEIMQPIHAWTAVVRGALSRGLDGTTVTKRRCRYHYGTTFHAYFDEKIHPAANRAWCSYREAYLVQDCMQWYVAKDQAVSRNDALAFPFAVCFAEQEVDYAFSHQSSNELLPVENAVYGCSDVVAPMLHKKSLIKVCTLKTHLKNVPRRYFQYRTNSKGHGYYQLEFQYVMKIDSASIHFELTVGGRTYGSVAASFHH